MACHTADSPFETSQPGQMVEAETISLVGPALDWVIATLEGWKQETVPLAQIWMRRGRDARNHPISKPLSELRYSTDRNLGGELLERTGISIVRCDDDFGVDSEGYTTSERIPVWCASYGQHSVETSTEHQRHDAMFQIYESEVTYGPSPLIAGLRCIVKAELGGKVLVPAELLAEKR
ncbi:TPA: hypothetical protein NIB55_005884 [Pseudomonas aeruginosa]|nr:hypothetical protein [Pseudomonas aeruginosa]